MLDQVEAFFSLLERFKKYAAAKQKTDTLPSRFVSLFDKHGVHRWLRENPVQPRGYSEGRGSGCLGILCLLFIMPVAAGIAVFQWMI